MPSQDIVLGLYYLSLETPEFRDDAGRRQASGRSARIGEIEYALTAKAIKLHDKIRARWETVDAEGNQIRQMVVTTPGRMLIAQILPKNPNVPFSLINRHADQEERVRRDRRGVPPLRPEGVRDLRRPADGARLRPGGQGRPVASARTT